MNSKANIELVQIFHAHGVPALSVQLSAIAFNKNGVIEKIDFTPIRHALNLNMVPIIAADMVFDATLGFFIGDVIAHLALTQLIAKR